MAQQPPTPGPRVQAQNDLYTLMLIIAAGLLLIGIVYLAFKCQSMFGSVWPAAGG